MSDKITYTPIESTALSGYSYDGTTRKLQIKYKNGGEYTYHDVSAERVEALREAKSPGGYFAAKIRNQHKATKI